VVAAQLTTLAIAGGCGLLLWRGGRAPAAAAVLLAGAVVALLLRIVLSRRTPPRFLNGTDTPTDVLIGYDLPEPVSTASLLLDWRFNLIFGTGALLLAAGYLLAVRRLARRGDAWPVDRTAAWLAGCAVLLLATSSGVGRYAAGVFSVHMVAHMALTMLAPALLTLGGPVTLVLRALPPAGRGRPCGPREWIADAVSSSLVRSLTHPLPLLTLWVGSFYALYLTGLFDAAIEVHWGHQLMNLHFVLVGYLFLWPLAGADPAPARLPHLARLAVLLASMPFHAFFAIIVMSTSTVIGGDFYRQLSLPWLPDLLHDQQVGGGLAWATGELPMLLVIIALLVRWARDDEREAARRDRRTTAADDELRTYNEMLARLAGAEPAQLDPLGEHSRARRGTGLPAAET
jgi:cytochrome c oxidase assembly factor CtaG